MTTPLTTNRPYCLLLCDGSEIRVEPRNALSLAQADTAVRAAMDKMGPPDGRVMFDVARRQLADIAATRFAS
jgi:hypothetical protein